MAQPPIVEIKDVAPRQRVLDVSGWNKPLVIRSEKEAADHFASDQLDKLKIQVDFEKQFVLLFAWRGSGQDRLSYVVAESYPEQVMFQYTPGRTKDLRPHVYLYALRSQVTWRVR